MCRVFLYSRVSTSAQTLAQQERTAYEWLKAHNMTVDEVVSDEGISGGVSYADRNLGKVLLPKTKEGDMIIVSEVSRLGRSMYNLSELIHKELKPRKIRLVCVNMGIDLDCSKMTAIDELIISNFSFAAQLEKQLISERTLSALQVKRQQGVKFGSASERYRENYKNKTYVEKMEAKRKMGATKCARNLASQEKQAFFKILRRVFPDATQGDIHDWDWTKINSKGKTRPQMLALMESVHDVNPVIFRRFDFSDFESVELQKRLSGYICNLRRAVFKDKDFNETNNQ